MISYAALQLKPKVIERTNPRAGFVRPDHECRRCALTYRVTADPAGHRPSKRSGTFLCPHAGCALPFYVVGGGAACPVKLCVDPDRLNAWKKGD